MVKSSEAWSLAGRHSPNPETEEAGPDLAAALHEVSNALTVVLGWLDGALVGLEHGRERQAVEVALSHARLGHRIARRAIGADVSDIEREREAVAVARDALLAVTPESRRRDVEVRFVDRTRGNELVADSPSALQILLNLLLNALAFSPSGGSVTLGVERDGDRVRYDVSDEGPGIAPERAEQLFSGPESTRRGGAGIGLRHSSHLAEVCGGELRLTRHVGGSTFSLSWPVSTTRTDSKPPSVPTAVLAGRSVLVVEDDAAVLSLIELALEARGAKVISIDHADGVLALLASGETINAALVDMSPIADRADHVLGELAGRAGVPVILISGVASGVPDGLEHHVRAWVRKPFEMGEIIEVLHALVAHR